LFADKGSKTWSFESAGSRVAVDARYLRQDERGEWRVIPLKELPENAPDDVKRLAEQEQKGEVTFTVFQVGLFFSVYVFFQVWNQINCRSLTPQVSGFHNLFSNKMFLLIAGLTAVGQVLIISIGGAVFKVEPLTPLQWLAVVAGTSSVLIFAEIARLLRRKPAEPAPAAVPAPVGSPA
jgi:magnesium-transporting ATPase (P-type)